MGENKSNKGHYKRLRDRFMSGGLDGFHDYEVVELLLTFAGRKDVKQSAKSAIKKFGSLKAVLEADPIDLKEIKLRGHSVMPLKIKGFHPEENLKEIDSKPWSKKIQEEDAIKTIKTIQGEEFDWLVLDHYFLNKIWERKVKGYVNYLFVIDDFTDRKHECDVLMNHGFLSKDREVFKELVSGKTKLLLGPKYVLLRPEYSLNRSNFSKKHNCCCAC